MRVLHFSDIHLLTSLARLPLADWLGKRLIGGANLLLRRRPKFKGGRRKVEALLGLCRSHDVDAVIFTGDYTTLGSVAELEYCRSVVEPLIQGPWEYVNVPGNHDLYLPDCVRERRFERFFGDTLHSDLDVAAGGAAWPLVRLWGDQVAVVATNSARPNPQPWRSSGRVDQAELQALRRVLQRPELSGRFVFVATHYAARLADGTIDKPHHGLENAEELLECLREIDRGALLCGHIHRCYSVSIDEPELAMFCAGSATYDRREGLWLFDVDGERATARRGRYGAEGWRLEAAVDV